jgi:hypothetical protein
MTLEDAVKHFGSGYKLCKALAIRMQNYTYWKQIGEIPFAQQMRIEKITKGILIAREWK